MTRTEIRDKAKYLGIHAGVSCPGDGKARYEFLTVMDKPHVYGRTLACCSGAKQAEVFLHGFQEGIRFSGEDCTIAVMNTQAENERLRNDLEIIEARARRRNERKDP